MDIDVKDLDILSLMREAVSARETAYAPYSGFLVGAALLSSDGRVFTGCNIENAAYSPGCCAERTAIFKAVSDGARSFSAIAVAGWPAAEHGKHGYAYPCGVCRQVMMEFCDPKNFLVIITSGDSDYRVHTLEQLLPEGFGPDNLKNNL